MLSSSEGTNPYHVSIDLNKILTNFKDQLSGNSAIGDDHIIRVDLLDRISLDRFILPAKSPVNHCQALMGG